MLRSPKRSTDRPMSSVCGNETEEKNVQPVSATTPIRGRRRISVPVASINHAFTTVSNQA